MEIDKTDKYFKNVHSIELQRNARKIKEGDLVEYVGIDKYKYVYTNKRRSVSTSSPPLASGSLST